MSPKEFLKYLRRDGGCIHCGEMETIAPHHRANRGMGGSKARDVPSNIVVMCSAMNTAMESNADVAALARDYGWKLRSFESPADTPVFFQTRGEWFLLNDSFGWKNI
jgi:hypothetical protein